MLSLLSLLSPQKLLFGVLIIALPALYGYMKVREIAVVSATIAAKDTERESAVQIARNEAKTAVALDMNAEVDKRVAEALAAEAEIKPVQQDAKAKRALCKSTAYCRDRNQIQ